MSTLPRQGDPNTIVCGCGLVRTVHRSDGEHVHRLCRVCDAPEIGTATWQQERTDGPLLIREPCRTCTAGKGCRK